MLSTEASVYVLLSVLSETYSGHAEWLRYKSDAAFLQSTIQLVNTLWLKDVVTLCGEIINWVVSSSLEWPLHICPLKVLSGLQEV